MKPFPALELSPRRSFDPRVPPPPSYSDAVSKMLAGAPKAALEAALAAPRVERITLVPAAVITLAAGGLPIPSELVEVLELIGPGHPYGFPVPVGAANEFDAALIDSYLRFDAESLTSRLTCEAFRHLSAAQQHGVAERHVACGSVLPLCSHVADEAMLDSVLAIHDKMPEAGMAVLELGVFGGAFLERLAEYSKGKGKKKKRARAARAVVAACAAEATEGRLWDVEYDAYFDLRSPGRGYDHGYYNENFDQVFFKAVFALPTERGETVLLENLDATDVTRFSRAVRYAPCHPTPKVLETVARGLLTLGASVNDDNARDITRGIAGLSQNEALVEWVVASGEEHPREALASAIGHSRYAEFEAADGS